MNHLMDKSSKLFVWFYKKKDFDHTQVYKPLLPDLYKVLKKNLQVLKILNIKL